MRQATEIKNWLSAEKLAQWVNNAPDQWSASRRQAILLAAQQHLPARKIAAKLQVSVSAVRKWIKQYNDNGPAGLNRKGRGGRRRYFMTLRQEKELLKPFIHNIHCGRIARAGEVRAVVGKKLHRTVSVPYIYRLLSRHGWAEIIAQSRDNQNHKTDGGGFNNISTPWRREN